MNKFFKYLPCATTLLIMLIIYYFSNQNAQVSTNSSSSLIITIINLLPDFLIKHDIEYFIIELSHIVRKTAHFAIYAALGASSYWMFNSLINKFKTTILIVISLAFCFIYACSDEIHQIFIAGRSGQLSDVFIDTIGAFTGILFIYLLLKVLRREKR